MKSIKWFAAAPVTFLLMFSILSCKQYNALTAFTGLQESSSSIEEISHLDSDDPVLSSLVQTIKALYGEDDVSQYTVLYAAIPFLSDTGIPSYTLFGGDSEANYIFIVSAPDGTTRAIARYPNTYHDEGPTYKDWTELYSHICEVDNSQLVEVDEGGIAPYFHTSEFKEFCINIYMRDNPEQEIPDRFPSEADKTRAMDFVRARHYIYDEPDEHRTKYVRPDPLVAALNDKLHDT